MYEITSRSPRETFSIRNLVPRGFYHSLNALHHLPQKFLLRWI
jgi:hypothetical protein